MAKKNLFISIGSTSTGALIKLIERLIDLDIYKPLDPNYKDMFVAIDTDNGPLEKILTFNSGEIAHTFAASFTRSGSEPPVPSHTFLRNSYRSDWDKESLAIKAADRGVGGQRIKSFATLEWKDTVRNVILTFLEGAQGKALLDDYQVILVSSSWGGTASGLFQNVSDFIASQLYERCGGSNNPTPFYAVLALPNYESAQSDRESKGYQGLENFAYFMRDVQQAGWRGSLPKIRNKVANENLSFIFPEFCNLDNNGKVISVDASSGSINFCGNRSALPQRAIIVVPTLGGSSTAITVAEQLLALGYLDIFKQPIDRGGTEVDSKFIDIRKAWDSNATNDCPALMGLNMVECQYSRYSVIAAVIKKELIKRWENFYSIYPGNDMAIKSLVREFIKKQIKTPAHSKEQKEHVLDSLGGQWVDDSDRLKVLKSKVVDFRDAVANDAYEFPRFDAAEELLAKFVEYTEGLNEKQKIVCEKSVTLEDIRQAYIQLLNEWYALAQRKPNDLVREIDAIIDNTVEQYNAIKKGKGFGGKIIKYCNGERQVLDELVAIARKLIEEKLDELQKLMCARATEDKFSLEKENKGKVVNNPLWQTANDQINRIKQECNDSDSEGENKFIKIVRNTALEGALQRNNLVNVTIEKCIELLKNSGDEASCQSCCEKLCRELVDATIAEMERRKINGVDDPAIITLKDSKVTGCCPGFYAPFEGGVRVHFYAKNNGATDVDWQDIDNFAFNSFVNLKRTEVNPVTPVSKNHIHDGDGVWVWWEENLTYDNAPLYGMWLGALDLNLTFKSVLSRVYTTRISQDIQDSAYRLVMDSYQQQHQCLQSLFEKIVIGAIWGIFNDTLQNKALNEGQTLSLKLTTPSGEVIWTKSSKRESDLGLLADNNVINVNFISDEFIRTIMPWTQDDNGTCRLAEAFDCQELYSLLLRQERFILTNIRLAPTEEQANAIVEFYNKLKQCIDVTVE